MAQLGRVGSEREALEVEQEASQREVFAVVDVLHDAYASVSRQQQKLPGRHSKIAWLLPGMASVSGSRRTTSGPSGTDWTHSSHSSAHVYRRACLHLTSV